jgi:hypothetical protein
MAKYEERTADRRVRIEDRGPRLPPKRVVEMKCCRRWLSCDGFTNTCDSCGADYNFAGQRLAGREQWGEETGEHLSDILRIK